jgi:hypothetical protein
MAVTQYQQYLADKSQTPMDSEACCLSLGPGAVVDFVNNTCTTGTQSFPLTDSCNYAAATAENAPDANTQQSGGGIGAWLSSNLETITSIGQGIGSLFGGTSPQTSPGPQTNLDTDTGDENGNKTLIAVAVAIFVVVVAIVLIRKSRK